MKAKSRTGEENFVTCMRKALAARYGTQPVSLGGVFNIVKGSAKLHVMVSSKCQVLHMHTLSANSQRFLKSLWSHVKMWITGCSFMK